MSSISESKSVDCASLSPLNIHNDTTSINKNEFGRNDNFFVNVAFQPYRFQQDNVEHDELKSNDKSTDKNQNDEKRNSPQLINKSCGHIE